MAWLALALAISAAAAPVRGGGTPAGCGWASEFSLSDLNDQVHALAVWDDGSGEALYAAGRFTNAGEAGVNYIAKWDGSEWSALSGPTGTGTDGQVHALAVYDDGGGEALYAGGEFTTAGGVWVRRIAKWDGAQWSALSGPTGTGVNSTVEALGVYDDGGGEALYAGGSFTTAGGVAVSRIAKWDGSGWSSLSGPAGTGTNGQVETLAVYDDGGGEALYAGGGFFTAGGVVVLHIAKWDGSEWSALSGPGGTGTDGRVAALAVYDDGGGPALYAAGSFLTAGGIVTHSIARWDGSAWSALGGPAGAGTDDRVQALAVYDDGGGPALYAGGQFTVAGGVEANHIARWDGSEWSALSGPEGTGTDDWVAALAVYDGGGGPALYAAGRFRDAGGVEVRRIARWDGSGWSALDGPVGRGLNNWVRALAVYDEGGGPALYAGGFFTIAGGVEVNHVARWDGSGWAALAGPGGTGTSGFVWALAVYDDGGGPALYAGGSFATAGGVAVSGIAKWDGSEWSALEGPSGIGVNGEVNALAVYDDGGGPALYAGGSYVTAGGVVVSRIARWDGSEWSALAGPAGTGVNGRVSALAVYDDGGGEGLYAGGEFTAAGGVSVQRVAKWDGFEWSALSGPAGTGVDSAVNALAVFDDDGGETLYAGGRFDTAGGVDVQHIAEWDGSGWSALAGPAGTGTSNLVDALAVYDDGDGEALYAGGAFIAAGGIDAHAIARWNGSSWAPLPGAAGEGMESIVSDWVSALAVHDDGGGEALFVGGSFYRAGGIPSYNIARFSFPCDGLFSDGFESGDTSAWSGTVP